jgi:hypothetical protein
MIQAEWSNLLMGFDLQFVLIRAIRHLSFAWTSSRSGRIGSLKILDQGNHAAGTHRHGLPVPNYQTLDYYEIIQNR